ncbi:MAG: S8 family serine peptidase [Candidatus Dormibacteria bacterium]
MRSGSRWGHGCGALAGAAAALLVASPALAATSTPNDPLFTSGDQWALTGLPVSIDAPPAWCLSTGAGVVVADVDTGADFSHQDLAGKLIAGAAFLDGTGSPSGTGVSAVTDDNGHGTMTTGIMVASTNNGLGIAAVAPDARALVVKVLDSQGGGHDNDVAAGINYAVAHGARVINLSLGPDVPLVQTGATSAIPGAIQNAYQHGVAVALAAGNSGIDVSPAALTQLSGYALVVGATGPDGSIASYSNSSVGVNIYAPGGDSKSGTLTVQNSIVSTWDTGGYAIGDGTSFATPQVVGVMALLAQEHPSWRPADIYNRILATARGSDPDLDAAAAVGASPALACGVGSASAGGGGGGALGGGSGGAGAPGGGAHPTSGGSTGSLAPGSSAVPATGSPAGGSHRGGGTLTPVTGASAPPPGAAPLPFLVAVPAAALIVGVPASTALLRRRARLRR